MTGIVNSTGARSGVIGTTVGTPSVSVNIGASAFLVGGDQTSWANISAGTIMDWGVAGDDHFNIGSDFNTSGGDDNRYVTPGAGLYMFGYAIFTGNADTDNGFAFYIDGNVLDLGSGDSFTRSQTDLDFVVTQSVVLNLASGAKVDVRTYFDSDFFGGQSSFWGYRVT